MLIGEVVSSEGCQLGFEFRTSSGGDLQGKVFKDKEGVVDKVGDGTEGFVSEEVEKDEWVLVAVENVRDDEEDFEVELVDGFERIVGIGMGGGKQLSDNEESEDGPPCPSVSDCGVSKLFGISFFGSTVEKNFTSFLTFDFLFVQVGVAASVVSLVGVEERCLRSFSIAVNACKVI